MKLRIVIAVSALLGATAATRMYAGRELATNTLGASTDAAPQPSDHQSARAIAARGRIEPASGVLRVAGPTRQSAVIAELKVAEGDWVEAGQLVAVLDGVAAAQAAVARLEAEARHADAEFHRCQALYRDGIVSASERDALQLRLDVSRAEVKRARADLDDTSVRAPIAGRILQVHAHRGERVGPEGIVEVGDTAHMEVVAEVYETDVAAVRVGQSASVSASALAEPLTGSVQRIGLSIAKLSVFDINPSADTDARVIQVRVRLDDSARVAALTNLQVDVQITL